MELIENEIYYAVSKKYGDNYIFTPNTKNNGWKGYICIRNGKLSSVDMSGHNNFDWNYGFNIEIANNQQKEWYNACKKAGAALPMPEFKEQECPIFVY